MSTQGPSWCFWRDRQIRALPWGLMREKTTALSETAVQTSASAASRAAALAASASASSRPSPTAAAAAAPRLNADASTAASVTTSVVPAGWAPAGSKGSGDRRGGACGDTQDAPESAASSGVRSSASSPAAAMVVSRATCSAVRGASPVTMATACADDVSASMTTRESARVLHSKATKPAKSRSRSSSARDMSPWRSSARSGRDASASTRMPCSARDA
mmetsp:Transcript_2573/g.8523  ORF Transcript_2573/g.8523 Transcript_2573/m.8523 type:complete len:218 (-) Transcript_2573:2181-2834(-)